MWRSRVCLLAGLAALAALASIPALTASPPAQAAFPGANGQIACEGFRDGDSEVYRMNPDGSGITYLTENAVRDGDPSWAPDGRSLAFESYRDGGSSEAYRMDADGNDVTRLTFNGPPEDRGTSWSPDGEQIAFHSTRDPGPGSHGGNFEVYRMDADGSDQVNLTNHPAFDAQPAWSPDGSKVAFNTNRDGGDFEIYVMNSDGTGLERLTSSPGEDSGPTWSPDGSQIAFQSRRDGNLEIYRMDADGSDVTRLTNNDTGTPFTTFDAFAAWSPDGERIAFTSGRDGDFEVYSMDAEDGSDVRRLTTMPGFDGRCDWGRATPTSKRDCEKGGYRNFNSKRFERFRNQGQCVSFVASGRGKSEKPGSKGREQTTEGAARPPTAR